MLRIPALLLIGLVLAPASFASVAAEAAGESPFNLSDLDCEEVCWKLPLGEFTEGATMVKGMIDGADLFILDSCNTIHAVDLERGVHRWVLDLPGEPTHAPGISKDFLAFVVRDRLLFVRRTTGSRVMDRNLKVFPATVPAVTADTVYTGIFIENRLISVDARTGTTGWSFRFKDYVTAGPKIYGEDPDYLLYAVSNDGSVVCLPPQPALGGVPAQARWTYKTDGPNSAEISLSGDLLFVPSQDTGLYAFNRRTGVVVWKYFAGVPLYSGVQLAGENVYLRTKRGFFCLNMENGEEKWSYEPGEKLVAIKGDACYVWTRDGHLAMLDMAGGNELKKVSLGEKVHVVANPSTDLLVISTGDTVYGLK
jgi:outer membrane protein assembly factor BamB